MDFIVFFQFHEEKQMKTTTKVEFTLLKSVEDHAQGTFHRIVLTVKPRRL